MNTLEIIKRLIRQSTVNVGQPVTNIHGRAPMTVRGASTTADVTWLRLTVPGTALYSIDEFYQRYTLSDAHEFALLQATLGMLVVHEPTVVVQLYRGVIEVDHLTTFTMTVSLGASSAQAALYVNGVLDRSKSGSLSTTRTLEAGRHLVELMVVGSDVTIETPEAIAIDGMADVVAQPVWLGAATGYLDTATGATTVRLQWLADVRSGGWKVFRREMTTLGAVSDVGTVEATGECTLAIAGSWASSLLIGNDLLAGPTVVGTVLSATYAPARNETDVGILLPRGMRDRNPAWVGRTAYTGINTELTSVKRTASTGVMSYDDTAISFKSKYTYTLQGYSAFDETLLSVMSEPMWVVAGDVQAPASVVIQDKGVPTTGYPQVRDKVARVKYRTPTDSDYAGVRVVYRTSITGTLTSATGTTLGINPAVTASALQGYTLRLTSGAAQGLERGVLSNTTNQVTLSDGYDSVNKPAAGDTFLAYSDKTVVVDYGAPNTDDELQFTTIGYGAYQFRAFDLVGNEQTDAVCETWTYSSADDTTTVVDINLPPTISIKQLDDATQASFFAAGDPRNSPTQYVLVQLDASDPIDGTTGVVIYYTIIGTGIINSLAASTAATTGVVDAGGTVASPNGTRSRYVLLSRGNPQSQLVAWAADEGALESGRVPFTADYDVTPEIVSLEARDIGGKYQFTVAVDDDTRGIRYWMEPSNDGADFGVGAPAHVDTTSAKSIQFTSVIPDGSLKVIKVVPYTQFAGGQAQGTAGDVWAKEISRTPRTTAVFESRDTSGNVSGTTVRVNLIVQPIRNPVSARTAAGSGNTTTTLVDSAAPGWATDQFGYSDILKRYYFVEVTSGVYAGEVRKLTGNTVNSLTFTPALPAAVNGVTYRIWNAATVVTTDGFTVGTQTPMGTKYVVGSTVWFDRRGSAPVNFSYNSLLNGTTPEALHTASVDQDTTASATGFNVTESPAGTLVATVAGFDDDTKYWRLYARKGALPTIGGAALSRNPTTNRLNLDDAYLRWEDTPALITFSFSVGAGAWYLILVPYNSYNEDGEPASATLTASGTGASPNPTLSGLQVAPNGTTENDLSWSLVNLPNPTGYTVVVSAKLDNGSMTALGTVAASALAYPHTGIGTRVADNTQGTWKVYTYSLQLRDGANAAVGAPATVQRGDYFAGASSTLLTCGAGALSRGSATPVGLKYDCTSSHINEISWTLSAANDTEYLLRVFDGDQLIAELNPSALTYQHVQDGLFEDATGAQREWTYIASLVRRSNNSIVNSIAATPIVKTVRSCFV